MRVLCIDNSLVSSISSDIVITIGRYYDIVGYERNGGDFTRLSKYYVLVDDNGYVNIFLKSNFKTMEDIRNDRLNELGL